MFARLNDNWYLNLSHVREVYFEDNGQARIESEPHEEGAGEAGYLTTWHLQGPEEVAALRAALREFSMPALK